MEGYNGLLDATRADIWSVKLKPLADWTARRRETAAWYRELFAAAGLAELALYARARVAPAGVPPPQRHADSAATLDCDKRVGLSKGAGSLGDGIPETTAVLEECGFRMGKNATDRKTGSSV